ncbi:MAG TPA: fibronectin type III domain-containing protein [Chthoniobacterales bacterium]
MTVKNGAASQLVARLGHPVKHTNLYEGRASIDGGTTWLPSVFTGDSRHIIFDGLTAGKIYTIQVRALGGSTGESDWSDPVSHMAM